MTKFVFFGCIENELNHSVNIYELFFRATDERTFGGHRRDMEDKTYRFGEKNITALRRKKQNLHDTIRE